MSRMQLIILIALSMIALILVGWKLSGLSQPTPQRLSKGDYIYQSQYAETFMYSPDGTLQYRLITSNVKHDADSADSWFTQPELTLYDTNAIPSWDIHAEHAKLTKQHILYLYGNVKVESLLPSSQLNLIETDSAEINLDNLNVSSNTEVTLVGNGFYSQGLKMHGNLKERQAELVDKVKTTYEIQRP